MIRISGQVFDSAHNFILHYLLTLGLPALLCLLCALFYVLYMICRKKASDTALFLLPFLCYLIQALIMPSTPIVTPLALIFLSIAYQRSKEPINQ